MAPPRLTARDTVRFTLLAAAPPPARPSRTPAAVAPVRRPPAGHRTRPGAEPPGAAPVPPAGVPLGAALLAQVPLAPGVVAPRVAPAVPPTAPLARKRVPAAVPVVPVPPPPHQKPRPQPQQHSLLHRFMKADRTPTDLGLMAALFLVLLPAAVAAAVLGTRRR